jgi:hypothetical protein
MRLTLIVPPQARLFEMLVYPYPPGPLSPRAEKGGVPGRELFKSLSVYGFEGGQVGGKH